MFEPIVPLLGQPINAGLVEDIRRMHEEFGIHRFVLIGPVYGSVSIKGLPTEQEFREFAEELLALRSHFAPRGIQIGWWCVCTMNNGARMPGYQHVVNQDGTISPQALCPLDDAWRKVFTQRIRIVVDIARPELILIEDDFELSNHSGVNFGCFCPLHMKALAEKIGRGITREQLLEMYRTDAPQHRDIKRQFTEVARKSIFLLAQDIRDTVDEIAPSIQIGVCEPSVSDRDGYLSLEEPEIFAGQASRPLIRVEGTTYSCRNASATLPETLAHAIYSFERMPEDFQVIHETDTYPHTRYFMSAQFFGALLMGAVACGARGSLLYGTQYLDDALEDDGYFRAYAKNARKLDALVQALAGTQLDGIRIIYSPELKQRTLPQASLDQLLPSAISIPGRFGIPYSTKNGFVSLLLGQMTECLSDAEILDCLAKGTMLDAQAAENLCRRGFGKYLGADVAKIPEYKFCQEILHDLPELSHIKGRHIYNYATLPAGSENDHAPYVDLISKGAEELSYFADYEGNRTNAACLRFENSLGGRVAIFASGFVGNGTSNLFCHRKKELFRALLEWLNRGPMPAVVLNRANAWLLVRSSQAQTFFMLTDLNGDDERELQLKFADRFIGKQFRELQRDGSWQDVALQWQSDGTAVLPGSFSRLEMRVFAVKQTC